MQASHDLPLTLLPVFCGCEEELSGELTVMPLSFCDTLLIISGSFQYRSIAPAPQLKHEPTGF